MSIKCNGDELFVGKLESNLISAWGKKTKIMYCDLDKIEYCNFKLGYGGGYLDFYKKDGKIVRFNFNNKTNVKIEKAIEIISENNHDLEINKINAKLFKFYQRDWFVIFMIFTCCMPLGLVLMWHYKKFNKFMMSYITALFIILWVTFFSFLCINYDNQAKNMEKQIYSSVNTTDKIKENNKYTEAYSTTLYTGHYIVGTDIPVGTYNFSSKSGSGNLFSSDGKINAIFDYNNKSANEVGIENFGTEKLNNVYLEDGVILSVTGTQEISAGCSDGLLDDLKSRSQDNLDELEIGYGSYGASDNIPAGIYDIELIEGMGNIICGTDLNNGINEIMGNASNEKDAGENVYITKFKNLIINEGDILEINDIKIKLIPSK